MIFEKHARLEGLHAPFSASSVLGLDTTMRKH